MIRPALRVAALAALCLAAGGCARLAQALFAPQQVVAGTAGAAADRSGARASADAFRGSVDRLLAGQPRNAAELQRIRIELQRRARSGRTGSAQDDISRRCPWDPRLPSIWRRPDRLVLERLAAPERGTYARFAPLPDGIPAGEAPRGIGPGPVRLPVGGPVRLPERLSP